jgi:autotransporter-associated beta strand protein
MKPISNPKLLALLLVVIQSQKILAAGGTWNVDAGGSWNTSGNWTPAAVPGIAAGDVVGLTFNISAARIVTNNTTVTLGTFNIGDTEWKSIGSGQILFENSSTTAATLLLGNNSGEADNSSFGAMVAAGTTLQLNRASSSSVHGIGGNGLTICGGTAQLTGGGGDQIYDGAPVTVNVGTFDVKGLSETIGSLAGLGGTVTNSGTVASTLTIGGTLGTGAGYYQGNIKDNAANGGTLNLVKAGAGTLILGGTNTYAGATTINGGTLQLQPAPTIPFASSLVYQLDASTLNLANGASVTSVPDGSGNGNTVTPYDSLNPPTYNAAGLNGKGTIHFVNTANVGLQTAGNFSISGSGARSVFAVIARSSGGSMLLSWGNTTAGNLFDLTIANSGLYYLPAVFSGGDNTFSTPSVDTRAHLCEATYDGSLSESGYLDGSLLGAKTLGGALSTTVAPLQIGYRSGDANKALGDVAEVLIYNTALTATQRQQVETYLLNKWFGNVGGPANVLPRTTTVSITNGATMDLNGTPQTVAVLADITGAGGLVTNSAASTPVVLTLAPTSGSTTFSGNINDNGSANAISVTVNGTSGTQVLAGANTYHGSTLISGGTLALSGSGSIANTPTITVGSGAMFNVSAVSFMLGASQTLKGNGSVNGATIINGSIAPGASIGTLTLSNSPTLNGTTLMEINTTNAQTADKLVLTSGTLTYGGTLTVTNTGNPLVGGEIFTNFSASSYAGAFSATNLPSLGAGLNWYLGNLTVNGSLIVNELIASNATYTRAKGISLKIKISDLLTNVSSLPTGGDTFALADVGASTNGATILTDSTYIFFTPGTGNSSNSNESFTYTVTDTRGGSATGTININVINAAGGPQTITVSGSTATVNFAGIPGYTYAIQRSTNLVDWATLLTTNAPSAGLFNVTDDFNDIGGPPSSAYYRTAQP